MKNRILIGTCLLATISAVYLMSRSGTLQPNPTEAGDPRQVASPQPIENEPDIFAIAKAEANLPADYVLTPEQREKILSRREEILRKQQAKEMMPTEEELKVMFDTPVEFYGQVLDQFDNPVVGANIRCSWGIHNPRSTPVQLLSPAPDGKFEILGHKALLINVSVYPPSGYDEQVKDSKKITIAQTPARLLKKLDLKNATPEQLEQLENFSPFWGRPEAYKGDKAKPVIFRLKKL